MIIIFEFFKLRKWWERIFYKNI